MSEPAKKRARRGSREQAQATDSARVNDIERIAALYAQAFGTKAGAEVLADLVKTYHVTSPAFMQAPSGNCDSHAAASRDGSKAVVFRILQQIAKGAKSKTVSIPIP